MMLTRKTTQSLLMSTTTVCVLLHVLSSGFVTAQNTVDFNYCQVSCNFSINSCGWKNVGGAYTATWVLDGNKARMYLSMNGDAKGRLASPWLDPLEDYQCSLKFDFVVNKWPWDSCQLTLIRQTASGSEEEVKVMDYDTGLGTSSDTAREAINCTGERYKIVFEGWKSCDNIWVDDIEYNYSETACPTDHTSTAGTTVTTGSDDTETPSMSSGPHVTSSTSPHATSSTSEHVTSSTSSRVTSSSSPHVTSATSPHVTSSTNVDVGSTDSTQGEADASSQALDTGSLAGIIIGGIVVVVVVVVIVMLIFKRRRRQDKPNVNSSGQKESLAVVNSIYSATPDEQGTGGHRRNHPASSSEAMELAPLPPSDTTPSSASSNGSSNLRPKYPHHTASTAHHPSSLPSPAAVPSSSSVVDSDTYENVAPPTVTRPSQVSKGANRQNHLTSKPDASSVTTSDDVYDHISRAQLRPVPDNPYDHTNKASLRPVLDDTYDHTTRQPPPPSVSQNTYNHTNERLLPPMSHSRASDTYNHLHLDSHPTADTPSDDTYTNVPQHPPATSDVYAQPQKKLDRKHHQGHGKTPPTIPTTTNSASSSSAGFAPVGISGHGTVPGGAVQSMRSSADEGDPYNRLDVTGERRQREEEVGENVYDHAKANDYDSLHEDDRKRTQQRQLAQDEYSHI